MKPLRFALLLIALVAAAPLSAQHYPSRPVRMLIPFPAGSAADIIARAMEPQMRERLGQAIVIDNRGGAGGNIAAELTAKAAPDGYTTMMATIGTHAINHSLYTRVAFHPVRDFTPIAYVGESPNVMVTTLKVQAATVKEFIALAKSKPGQLNYGSSGAGTTVHLSGELFNSMAGVKTVHVPFKGASEALTGLLGGQTDFMFASLSSAMPFVKTGKLKAFAVTGAQRSPSIPELPTMSESALPGFSAAAWFGIVGPAGIPPPVVATLSKMALSSLDTKEVKDRLFASGVEIRPASADDFGRLIKSEMEKWAKVVKAAGLKAD
ncbi:MAG TPA: tripartite tricarboxylate transporter substrate binding protein [Burkholderiales bacterium]|nr:tripartite tricarboxylate transporter substrate binding protein [Burkholderiales bacterium]